MTFTRLIRWIDQHPIASTVIAVLILGVAGGMDMTDALRGAR